jgi:polysaccharide export outer membrane protein
MGLLTAVPNSGGQTASTVSKELVQYIRDAKRLGLKDAQIREDAMKAGWPSGAIDQAFTTAPGAAQPAAGSPPATTPPTQPEAQAEAPRDQALRERYIIGEGDVLQISVWGEREASVPSVVVRPDGKISMPLVKEVPVAGLTPTAAEKLITAQLSKLIKEADATVVVTGINSKKVFMVGAVKKEGPIAYTYRMTIMQAISEAGGLTDYAKRKKIYVLRTEDGKDYRLPFNYDDVLKGERMEQNISLLPNDTLVVPH